MELRPNIDLMEADERRIGERLHRLARAGNKIKDARHFVNFALWTLRKKPWYWQILDRYTFQVVSVEKEPDQFRISDSWRDLIQDLACFALMLEKRGAFKNMGYDEAQAHVFGWFWDWAYKSGHTSEPGRLIEIEEYYDDRDYTIPRKKSHSEEYIDLRELLQEDSTG